MGKKRKTLITVETERVIWLRKRRGFTLTWCSECGEQTRWVSTDEAALISHVSRRAICGLVEAGKIHLAKTPDGLLSVCLKSLSDLKAIEEL